VHCNDDVLCLLESGSWLNPVIDDIDAGGLSSTQLIVYSAPWCWWYMHWKWGGKIPSKILCQEGSWKRHKSKAWCQPYCVLCMLRFLVQSGYSQSYPLPSMGWVRILVFVTALVWYWLLETNFQMHWIIFPNVSVQNMQASEDMCLPSSVARH